MSKRILWILTITLSLAMIALITVQLKWIRNVVELHDMQFRQLVNTTLADMSRKVEQYYAMEKMNMVIDEKNKSTDEIEWNISIEGKKNPVIFLGKANETDSILPDKESRSRREFVEVLNDTLVIYTETGDNKIDTLHIKYYQDQLDIEEIEASLKEQEILVKTVMKKMLAEEVPFEERVKKNKFEELLRKNIRGHGIDLDYEYTILKNNKQEIYSSEFFDKNTDFYYYKAGLMSDQILGENTNLYLYFPDQKAYVRSSMGFLGSTTVFLTLLMIVLFTFALYVIFRQKKLSDVKNDFVNNMTHELKTPISTISLASQMLSDESIPMEKKNTAHISRIIQTESKRLGYQVERVLQMAVLDQGHLTVKKDQLSMREIVSNVMQNFKIQIESRNGSLEVIDEADYDMVNGDRVHLMNVVTNLLDNAVKYSKDKPVIEVRMSSSSSNFTLMVKDNGIGISKENQRKVFDKFYRVSTGNVHDVKGFGLGLSYVKLIVDQHGGSIDLSSEIDKGTKFTINLPLYSETQAI